MSSWFTVPSCVMPISAPMAMKVNRRLTFLILVAAMAWAGLDISAAHGSSMQLPENDVAGLGTSFAGVGSAAQTPATSFENPAGLVRLPGIQVSLGAILAVPHVVFSGSATSVAGKPLQGSTKVDAGNTTVIPNLFASYDMGPRLAVGLAITSPFGTSTNYGPEWVGRYSAYKTEVRTLDVNPSIAYRVAPWLSVGAGFSVQKVQALFSSMVNSSSIASAAYRAPISLPDGYINLRGSSIGVGYNIGVLIEPIGGTRVGLTYRSRINHVLSGNADFDMPTSLSSSAIFKDGSIRTKLTLPDTARVSLTQALSSSLTGYFDATWTDWSRFKALSIIRSNGEPLSSNAENYRNSFTLALGASLQLSRQFTLRVGTAYEKSPVQDAFRGPRGPEADHYWLSIGAGYEILTGTTLEASYAHVFTSPVGVIDQSSTGDNLQGRSRSSIDFFGVGVRAAF